MSSVEDESTSGDMHLQISRPSCVVDNHRIEHHLNNASLDVVSIADEHCHSEELPDDTVARNQLIIVSVLCFAFMIGEIVGGLLAHSLAIATDATHMASDLASFLISLFAMWLAKRRATIRMSFGYYRAEVLGAMISVLTIWVITAILVYLAVERIHDKDYQINSQTMLITASVGVAFNIVMGAVLHGGVWKGCHVKSSFGHGHSHDGGHSHGSNHHATGSASGLSRCDSDDDMLSVVNRSTCQQWNPSPGSVTAATAAAATTASDDDILVCTAADDDDVYHLPAAVCETTTLLTTTNAEQVVTPCDGHQQHTNINVRAALIHVIGDLIQSIGVLVAAIIIHVKPEYGIVDPICTFIFSFLVLCTTINVLRDVLLVIMEGVPRGVDYRAIKTDLEALDGVRKAHNLNVWALTIGRLAVGVHLAVDPGVQWPEILTRATVLLRRKYKVHQSTIQVENYQESVMNTCRQCQNP